MNAEDYQLAARRTQMNYSEGGGKFWVVREGVIRGGIDRGGAMIFEKQLLHASGGIASEAGEVLSLVEKACFYERPLVITPFLEEIGDILWYISNLLDGLGANFSEVFEANIAKLKIRYPDKFDGAKGDRDSRETEKENLALQGLDSTLLTQRIV